MSNDFGTKVLKPGSDRTVQPGKPRTAHFCDSFSLKNCSMGKTQGLVWTMRTMNGSRGSFFFSKYQLKLKIWPACTLDFFQIWNQKIYERKKENKLRRRRWKVGVVRSWRSKLATQHRSPVMAFIFIFIFCFYFFFLLLFLLLLFLLSVSTIVVSVSHLLSICVCADSFVFFLCFQGPFTWLTLGKKKTFNFWIKDGKMF